MRRRFALAFLAFGWTSCASRPELYETEDADAAPIYRSLVGRVPRAPECVLKAFNGDSTDEGELRSVLATYDSSLADLSRAARSRRCEWTYDKPPSITEDFPIDYGISIARVLVVRSRRRWGTGDHNGSIEDMLVLSRFGNDLAQDRWAIGKLVGAIDMALAAGEMRDRIIAGSLSPEQNDLLERSLASIVRKYPPPERFLQDERLMGLALLEEIRDLGFREVVRRVARDKEKPKDAPFPVELWESWLRATLTRNLDGTRAHIKQRWVERTRPMEEELRKPINQRNLKPWIEKLEEMREEVGKRTAQNLVTLPFGNETGLDDVADLLLLLWVPALEKAARNMANGKLLLLHNWTACRLELHFRRMGTYPETLDPSPEDPYTGNPLLYRRIHRMDGEGFVLASAGPKDDAEVRVRALADECDFDWTRFELLGFGDADALTMGVFRKRASLH